MAETARKFNWWIVAFLAALLAFEFAREAAVAEANEPIHGGSVVVSVLPELGIVDASGQWIRSDAGSPIVPTSVAIRCTKALGQCIEATTNVIDRTMYTHIDIFDQVAFTDEAVTYVNDEPNCVTYTVRIDAAQKRVTATRERKDPACDAFEKRVTMELGDGHQQHIQNRWADDHFLPIFKLIQALAG